MAVIVENFDACVPPREVYWAMRASNIAIDIEPNSDNDPDWYEDDEDMPTHQCIAYYYSDDDFGELASGFCHDWESALDDLIYCTPEGEPRPPFFDDLLKTIEKHRGQHQ